MADAVVTAIQLGSVVEFEVVAEGGDVDLVGEGQGEVLLCGQSWTIATGRTQPAPASSSRIGKHATVKPWSTGMRSSPPIRSMCRYSASRPYMWHGHSTLGSP